MHSVLIMASTTDMEQEGAERREAQDIATPGVEDEQIAEDLNLEDIYPEPKSLFPWRLSPQTEEDSDQFSDESDTGWTLRLGLRDQRRTAEQEPSDEEEVNALEDELQLMKEQEGFQ